MMKTRLRFYCTLFFFMFYRNGESFYSPDTKSNNSTPKDLNTPLVWCLSIIFVIRHSHFFLHNPLGLIAMYKNMKIYNDLSFVIK